MAFNQEEGRAEFTASAAQVSFPFTFKVYVATDAKVYLTPFGQESNDANDILILTTDYSIAINGDLGGVLTLTTGASNGDSITIVRDLPINRPVEYQTNGDMLATTLNGDQNYQTYLTSDRDTVAQRHIRIPDSTQNVSVVLPDVIPDSYLVWNSDGTALINDTTIPEARLKAEQEAWASEASRRTSESYAVEFIDGSGSASEFVNVWTSNGDGTYTATPQTNVFSAKWYEFNSASDQVPTPVFPADEGLALVARQAGNDWEKIKALDVSYDNTLSGLLSTDTNSAIDEVNANGVSVVGDNAFTGANTFSQPVATDTLNNFDSTISLPVSDIKIGIATAWGRFDGVTVADNGSFNIGSITNTGIGFYDVLFSDPMDTAGYSVTANGGSTVSVSQNRITVGITNISTTGFSLQFYNIGTGSEINPNEVMFTVVGGKN